MRTGIVAAFFSAISPLSVRYKSVTCPFTIWYSFVFHLMSVLVPFKYTEDHIKGLESVLLSQTCNHQYRIKKRPSVGNA